MKLSIITINYNNSEGLERTILSVINQNFQDFEFIIVDGNSTDKSKEIIKKHQGKITKHISEKDDGIYDAMNKGINISSGEYLLMLNSGDYLVNNQILKTVFNYNFEESIVYGNVIWREKSIEYPSQFPENLSFKYFMTNSIGHQATFIKNSVHKIVGLYDNNYKITADWKLLVLALFKYNLSFKFIPIEISVCTRDGMSCDPLNWDRIVSERNNLLSSSFKNLMYDYHFYFNLEKELINIKSGLLFRIVKKMNNFLKILS